MKKQKQKTDPVLKCCLLSANTVERCIDEIAEVVEKTFVSKLRGCKFAIQLDKINSW